jgi:hypothetical protein
MNNSGELDFLNIISKTLALVGIAVLTVGMLLNYFGFSDVGFWRHDSMYYEVSYLHKLSSEGRWINYILSPLLRILPPLFAIALVYSSLIYFCYAAAQRLTNDKAYSLILALIVVNIPFLQLQLLWPATTLPGFLALASSAYLAKRISPYFLMAAFSIIFFGTLSHLYFLLPVLYLRDLNKKKFIGLFLAWVFFFILGYLVSQGVTFLITSEFIEMADWRKANRVESFSDLQMNTERVLGDFLATNIKIMGFVSFGVVCALINFFIDRKFIGEIWSILILFFASVAVYISSIYLGLGVAERTAFGYVFCLIFIIFARQRHSTLGRFISIAIALLVGTQLSLASHKAISWYATSTMTIRSEMEKALPRKIDDNTRIILSMSDKTARKIVSKVAFCEDVNHITGEGIASTYRFSQGLRELGIKRIFSCQDCDLQPDELSLDRDSCNRRIFRTKRLNSNQYVILPQDSYFQ